MSKPKVTPLEVRDALEECFLNAHGDEKTGMQVLKQQYKNAGASYEKPTKADLAKVVARLENVARSFRNPDVIRANKSKIVGLLNRCVEK